MCFMLEAEFIKLSVLARLEGDFTISFLTAWSYYHK